MSSPFRRRLKDVGGRVVFASGLNRLWMQGDAVIIAFHTIGEHEARKAIQVSRRLFTDYCRFFRRHFDVVPLGDLVADLREGRPVTGKLVITFDDGYRDNYTFAAPTLEQLGLPATFFVTTDFVGTDTVPHWEANTGVEPEWMSWEEVGDLDRRGFDIGGHTRSHADLGRVTLEEARREIVDGRDVLVDRLGHRIPHFAYPYGRAGGIGEEVRQLIDEAGFDCCVSCFGGLVTRGDDPMHLGRVPVNYWHHSAHEFGFDTLRSGRAAQVGYGGADLQPILIASYHLYPDPAVGARRPSELLHYLRGKGYPVDGIAGLVPRRQRDPDNGARLEGARVMRQAQPPSLVDWIWKSLKRLWHRLRGPLESGGPSPGAPGPRRETLLSRARRNYNALAGTYDGRKWWLVLGCLRLLPGGLGRRYSIVLSSGPPSASHLLGRFAAGLHGARYVMDFRDPWVGDSGFPEASSSRLRCWLEHTAERRCIARADLIVCTTPGIAERLKERYPDSAGRIFVVYNGFDTVARQSPPLSERLDLLFAGTLYLNRNPFPLMAAVRELVGRDDVDRARVSLTFVGDCASWNGESLAAWIEEHELGDVVSVLPTAPFRQVQEMSDKATVLVNFAQGQPLQVPAKTFDYLASGKLLLVATEEKSATAVVMRKAGIGHLVTGSDVGEIVGCLAGMYDLLVSGRAATNAHSDALQYFSRRHQNREFFGLLLGDSRG